MGYWLGIVLGVVVGAIVAVLGKVVGANVGASVGLRLGTSVWAARNSNTSLTTPMCSSFEVAAAIIRVLTSIWYCAGDSVALFHFIYHTSGSLSLLLAFVWLHASASCSFI